MFYNVNLFIELLNFYSSGSKFLKDYLNKLLSPFESKVFLTLKFKILPMLNENRILLMGNTDKMAGGWLTWYFFDHKKIILLYFLDI